eukprot:1391893-Amorphochlora_amoeboformis.AAC.2
MDEDNLPLVREKARTEGRVMGVGLLVLSGFAVWGLSAYVTGQWTGWETIFNSHLILSEKRREWGLRGERETLLF